MVDYFHYRNLDEVFTYNQIIISSLLSRSHVKKYRFLTRADNFVYMIIKLFIHNMLISIFMVPGLTRFKPTYSLRRVYKLNNSLYAYAYISLCVCVYTYMSVYVSMYTWIVV